MTGLAKYLGRDLTIRKETRIDAALQVGGHWDVVCDSGRGVFDRAVITAPAPQIGALLPDGHSFNASLDDITMDPCLNLMIALRGQENFYSFPNARRIRILLGSPATVTSPGGQTPAVSSPMPAPIGACATLNCKNMYLRTRCAHWWVKRLGLKSLSILLM